MVASVRRSTFRSIRMLTFARCPSSSMAVTSPTGMPATWMRLFTASPLASLK